MRWIATWHCSACAALPSSRRTWSAGSVPNRYSAATLPDRRAAKFEQLIRARHYGQRSCEPPKQAEHMAAPTRARGDLEGAPGCARNAGCAVGRLRTRVLLTLNLGD